MSRVDREITSDALKPHLPEAQPWMSFPACLSESAQGTSQPASTPSRCVDSRCSLGQMLPSVSALPSDPGIIGFGSGSRAWGAVHFASPAPSSATSVRTGLNQRRRVLSCASARCADLSVPSSDYPGELGRRSPEGGRLVPLRPLTPPLAEEGIRPLDPDTPLLSSAPSED